MTSTTRAKQANSPGAVPISRVARAARVGSIGFALSVALGVALSGSVRADDAGYPAEIQKWRADFDEDVRTGGWLAVVARARVAEGQLTVGSDPRAGVTLPARSPRQVGTLVRKGRTFRFRLEPGIKASLDDKPVSGTTQLSTEPGSGRLTTGTLKLTVRAVGSDFYLLVQDTANPAIQKFKGSRWFDIDPGCRVEAKFLAYPQPRKARVSLTHVDTIKEMESTGDVTFQFGGKEQRLKSFIDEGQLFLMFRDDTSGKETYGGGRFLYAPLPKDGVTVLDFNKAFNPYCSLNDYIMCPVPPPGNRLSGRVAAGEKYSAR